MLLIILLNSAILASFDYDDPLSKESRNKTLDVIDKSLTGIYTVEAVLKIIAYGFFVHPKSYLRDSWNGFDFLVLIISYISMLPSLPNLKVLRVLRVLKPLRSINAVPSMKKQFTTLIMSIPGILQVVLFLMFFFGVFSILGN
jgi:voltage-dependent calcium channel L type alpha-1D